MASQPLNDLPEPKKTSDAVTKTYVDDLIADNVSNIGGGGSLFFKENGNYQATHAINMAFKKLLNLSTPSEPYEAATKKYMYVDDVKKLVDNVRTVNKILINQKPNIIVVNARYIGKSIGGKYQFAFAGRAIDYDDDRSVFVVPHEGFIKKVKVKLTPNDNAFFRPDNLFAITIDGIEVVTCFIENYPVNLNYPFIAVVDVKVATNPFPVNIQVKEDSIIK